MKFSLSTARAEPTNQFSLYTSNHPNHTNHTHTIQTIHTPYIPKLKMTSWDRVRFLPWTRISQVSGPEYESAKEGVYRSLTRDASREKELLTNPQLDNDQQQSQSQSQLQFIPPEVQSQNKKKGLMQGVEYTAPDMIRSLAFGASIGSITGAVFGFMDGMRSAGESPILKKASNMAKTKYLMQGTTRAGATFGLFFAGFHGLKYGIRVAADPGMVWEMVGAGVLSVGAMSVKPAMRVNLPYAGMLIGMDAFSNYMRETQ